MPRASTARPVLPGYDGNGVCYVAFGPHRAARLNITIAAGARPYGSHDAPSEEIANE
ncbi:hypothetical protein [Arthrobacter sp. AQ5-05]|uniref:hypothetical protein n=1 Tax=Arthrobacter sp. AQ5-05 TaxID=2184581 RepID=UPI001C662136|nr:hypothetical protein [Arthrobacter sp. AQ5-05]